jgi:ABC-2 type transport system permease protein
VSAGRPAGVVTPAGPVAVAGLAGRHATVRARRGRPPLLDALHAEWTKLRTVPSTGWLLATSVVVTVAVSVSVASVVVCQGPAKTCSADPAKLSLIGVMLGQATIAVLAVMFMTGEYSSGMIRVTLAGMPRRTTMLAAKAMVLTAIVLATGAVAVLGSVLLSGLFLPGNGFTAADGFVPVTLTHAPVLRAAAGSVLYFELIALLSLGLATALRDSGFAMTVVLGLLYVLPVIGTLLHGGTWARRIERYSPMDAGLAVQATRNLARLPIGPWEGLGVLGCWAGAAMLAGWLVLRLRDA